MKFYGKLFGISKDFETNKYIISFLMNEGNLSFIDEIKDKALTVSANVFKKNRSNNANRLLWECIGQMAKAKKMDKWDVYLDALKHYGKYTYGVFRPQAVPDLKRIWREVEVIGEVECNGQTGIQCLLYYGSSTYDTKEFAAFLDCIFAEMEGMGLETPTQKELQRSLEEWEKLQKKKGASYAEEPEN